MGWDGMGGGTPEPPGAGTLRRGGREAHTFPGRWLKFGPCQNNNDNKKYEITDTNLFKIRGEKK